MTRYINIKELMEKVDIVVNSFTGCSANFQENDYITLENDFGDYICEIPEDTLLEILHNGNILIDKIEYTPYTMTKVNL